MGFEAACRDTVLPLGWLMCTRNTSLTRVFLRPMSVSPLRSSMSELRSFRIPAQSILEQRKAHAQLKTISPRQHDTGKGDGKVKFTVYFFQARTISITAFQESTNFFLFCSTPRVTQGSFLRDAKAWKSVTKGWNRSLSDLLLAVKSKIAATHRDQQWSPHWCYRSCTGSLSEHDRVIINPACHQRKSWTLMSLHHGFKWPEWSKYSEKCGLSAPWLTSITQGPIASYSHRSVGVHRACLVRSHHSLHAFWV